MNHRKRIAQDLEDGNEKANTFLKNLVTGKRHCGIAHIMLLTCLLVWLTGSSSWVLNTSNSCWVFWFSSLTSGPSACLVPRQWAPVSLPEWPHARNWKFGGKERLTGVPVLPYGFWLSSDFWASDFSLLFQLHVHPSLLSAWHGNFRLQQPTQKQELAK